MVVKMMSWRPWPPLASKKLWVRLKVRRLQNLSAGGAAAAEIGWKGPPSSKVVGFRRSVKRNCTREEVVKMGQNGVVLVEWDEEFHNLCCLSGYRDDSVFHPWEISFSVFFFNVSNQGTKNKVQTVGTATLNLAEFAAKTPEEKEFNLDIRLVVPGSASETQPSLSISLSLTEPAAAQEPTEPLQKPLTPAETSQTEKDELSALKAGLRKVKIFTDYVSVRRAKKPCREEDSSDSRYSRSEEGDYTYPFDDSESLDGHDEERKGDSPVRKSFSYGTLASANFAEASFYSNSRVSAEDEDWVYYSNRRSDVGCSNMDDWVTHFPEPVVLQNPKRSLLPWRKRKLSFRSPKAKGEPLLKKDSWEEGGDDIDYDRRQLSSDESVSYGWLRVEGDMDANRSSVSGFCDDSFTVGSWEQKEVTSRDGSMILKTQIFFASIDQRSERAAGESACTALVVVIADWLQTNPNLMPIKSQFDSLIREGSLEWRNLCQNETYREKFPDKHFDLETVLRAEIRSVSVDPSKSFVGFFQPEGLNDERFDFLHGAMSFDNIWDEISRAELEPRVYIVSWNDHFFVLKVDPEAYYIVDTLGERLFEGCDQAYILKFDKDTALCKLPSSAKSSEENPSTLENSDVEEGLEEPMKTDENEEIICRGKESCKSYIKEFLAAIPIRELQEDMKKGLVSSVPLHHRLQIEFHYTQSHPLTLTSATPASEAFEFVSPEVAA